MYYITILTNKEKVRDCYFYHKRNQYIDCYIYPAKTLQTKTLQDKENNT